MKITDLKVNPENPRYISKEQMEKLVTSIRDFPKMMKLRPIVHRDGIILGGNMRFRALQELGFKEIPDEWVRDAKELTENEIREFIIKDNVGFGAWDMDMLANEWDTEELESWGMDYAFFAGPEDIEEHGKLSDRFLVPPFSVLDTRQGYWINRRNWWLEKTGDLTESRTEIGLIGVTGDQPSTMLGTINNGTSTFDPVLAELVLKWFCVQGGKVLDPFAGEQTKGVVAGELGFKYTGVEIRKEQVAVNKEKVKQYKGVKYVLGDSNKIASLVPEIDFDLCFTSPPYYDLEVYSKEDLSALGTYKQFMEQYASIFKACVAKLKNETFLVVKVGEIRDRKTGIYRSFVADNIALFTKLGLKFYNELILVEQLGTLPQRVGKYMVHRKVGKCHQQILVFYKGDPANIKDVYHEIKFDSDALTDGNSTD